VQRNPAVDEWFATYDHPLNDAMLRVRDIILEDSRMEESIKWKTPTFSYRGNLASFNPRSKAHVSLLFHTGSSIPGTHPRLEGGGDVARYMRLTDLQDVEAAADDLRRIVAAWCDRP
jgi:Domain of unknown function (DU1801)